MTCCFGPSGDFLASVSQCRQSWGGCREGAKEAKPGSGTLLKTAGEVWQRRKRTALREALDGAGSRQAHPSFACNTRNHTGGSPPPSPSIKLHRFMARSCSHFSWQKQGSSCTGISRTTANLCWCNGAVPSPGDRWASRCVEAGFTCPASELGGSSAAANEARIYACCVGIPVCGPHSIEHPKSPRSRSRRASRAVQGAPCCSRARTAARR